MATTATEARAAAVAIAPVRNAEDDCRWPMMPPALAELMTEPSDAQDISDPTDAADPMLSTEPADPTQPMDSTEFVDPIDSSEPLLAHDHNEGLDPPGVPVTGSAPRRCRTSWTPP